MSASILIALLGIKGVGPQKANKLIRSIPRDQDTDLASAIEDILRDKVTSREWRLLCIRGSEIVEESLEYGLTVVDYFSPDYPENLRRLDNSPLVIYAKGHLNSLKTSIPLAIVGSRTPCPYTNESGTIVSRVAASKSTAVISGLAIGCDTIAHRQALAAGVPTVGVVAHGLDSVYPRENESLASEIIESGGCLVSEYPVGISPRPNHFIERDRIQAGLSRSGLLLQSSARGGSMHAMRALQKLKARIGVLVPPKDPFNSNEWGGTIELMSKQDTIVLDPMSECLYEDTEVLVGKEEFSREGGCFTQASLF